MPDSADSNQYVKPFVYETLTSKALHFTISEIQSRMQTLRPNALDLAYTRTMMGFLLFNHEPATLAMIGLGGGSMAKFCHRYLPTTRIKVIEINPHVIALRDEFQVPRDDERFKVRRGDGAEFVRSAPYRLDVLLVDGFDYEGQPPALCSQRFYDDCYDALQPDGLMVVNLHTGHRDFNSQVARIERTFGSEVLLVGDDECSNTIVFACKGLLSRQLKPSIPRKPKGFDRETWDELVPAFFSVASALERVTKADLPSGRSAVRFKS
ncbi:transferase [Rhizobacter sp. OV335]|uniref:spermine/spermidine synthase domain-containing protein n=1 Tax=Rhizobacter sp. OV335 TaxID=1500264 RepID=UPI00091C37AF|nr:transferase [Rhizobacter sp. OV335]SHN13796.1 spermidine synthase [Rhizobacter sp. OV335]